MRGRRRVLVPSLALAACLLLAGEALAHGGSLRGAPQRSLFVPTWLFLATGGAVVAASFLLATFATDREFIRWLHEWRRRVAVPADRALAGLGRAAGVLGLLAVVGVGLLGPTDPLRNLGVLVVWVGWWAGFTTSTYLLGNAWPTLNPWRTLAGLLPTLGVDYPDRLGAWPSVVGLLGLVWLEVVSPLADVPRLLAGVVLVYTFVTLAGAVAVGRGTWFRRVDPVARVFRAYGRVAPLTWDDGLGLRLPGTGLDVPGGVDGDGDVAFVVAVLWVTTYDGLVATPPWRAFARGAVGAGAPAVLLYPLALVAGYLLFLGAYRLAVRYGARYARTYRPPSELAREFAPSLLAIAAGYHLAHYLGYFLELLPALVGALAAPLSPPAPVAVVLPAAFEGLALSFVVLGHLLAIWVAHAVAYRLFPSRLQAIRSQYALTAVMVFYTMTSLWVVSRPYAAPPFV